jgi:Zn-dependent M28 family amino/carboxypeptidase
VIVDTPFGNPDQIVMMGAHVDSTFFALGINDKSVGNGMHMEIGKQMAYLGIETENKIKFAFYGAEENSLLGP